MQFTDHMKPKKKEDQNVDASVLLRSMNKILTGGNMETKTEGKAIQRLSHLGIHSIYSLIWLSPERLFQSLKNTEVGPRRQTMA